MPEKIFHSLAILAVGLLGGWGLAAISAQVSTTPANVDNTRVGTAESPLATLDWLVGTWVAQTDTGSMEFSCNFTKNNAFLIRSFRVLTGTNVTMTGMQVVAWDPAKQALRSWTFDSDGGFGEDVWTQSGNSYTMRSKYTLADGSTGSALNMMKYVGQNEFVWKSTQREIDGHWQPDGRAIGFARANTNAATAVEIGGGSN